MKTALLLLAGLFTGLAQAQTFQFLDINQVKARVNSGGDLNFDAATATGSYECPIGSGKNYSGPASLWVGGIDAGGQLKLAAQTDHQGGIDYYPGPLDLTTATTNSTVVNQYNRVWKLNKTDIDDFITNYANGNVQNGSFIPAPDLLSWPGNGDISQNQDAILAPFADLNGDNIYDPMGAGEYPIIKGDQAIYTIFNDAHQLHASGGKTIGLEIRLMAYAYGPCSVTASNPFLNYTTFYNYKIINRSSFYLQDVYAALFNDSDIGNYNDDFVGYDVEEEYGYTYNGISSPSQPALGVVKLKGPFADPNNGIDDDNDGIIDELGEELRITNFMYFNNPFPGIAIQTTDPSNATEYFQYMKNYWKDGIPLTCGGNGYGGSTPTNFAYTSNTYTIGACGSTNWNETGVGSDKKFVMSSGPYTLLPGSITELEYAFISSFDSITNNQLGKLDNDVQNLKSIYNSTINQCTITGIKEQNLQNEFSLFPNPTKGILTINVGKSINGKIEIVDALGKLLISEEYKVFTQSTINVNDLSSGIYFVKLSSGNATSTKKFIKQ